MSDIVTGAVAVLTEKLSGPFDGSAKFEIEGAGAILIDGDGVRAEDGEADVTLKADAETFQAILDGDLDPTAAFMTGRLEVDGDMASAMKLGGLLS